MSPTSRWPAHGGAGWQAQPIDEARASALAAEIGVRRLTAAILLGRGLGESARAARFLTPRLADLRPPEGMADLERALDRLVLALARRERIGDLRRLRRRRRHHRGGAGERAARAGRRRDPARRQPPRRLRRRPRRRGALRRRGLPRAGHRRLRHQRSRGAGAGSRARPRRHRHRPPPGAVGRERGVRAHQPAPARRPLPVQGARVVRSGVLPGGARCARASPSTPPASIRATCWIWSRWARSPTWCRSSTRTGSWSPPACGRASARKRPGLRALAALAGIEPDEPITAERRQLPPGAAPERGRPAGRGAAGAGSVAGARRRDRRPAGRRARRMQPPSARCIQEQVWTEAVSACEPHETRRRAGGRRRGLAPRRGRHRRRQAGREVRAPGDRDRLRSGAGAGLGAHRAGVQSLRRARARAPRTSHATAATPPRRA